MDITYTCPKNITSFFQCNFPDGVTHVYCRNNQIKSFQYLPRSVRWIYCDNNQINSFQYLPESVLKIFCGNNQINSFQYLPGSVREIFCQNNQINSFKYLPGSVREICCHNNQINSFQYLPRSVRKIWCGNNTCYDELISKGLNEIYQENTDKIISDWMSGISKLRHLRLNYLVHTLWERYWYDQRDAHGYSRACKYSASKNCPNGFLSMN